MGILQVTLYSNLVFFSVILGQDGSNLGVIGEVRGKKKNILLTGNCPPLTFLIQSQNLWLKTPVELKSKIRARS